ncbi:hypothetical protein [Fibrisoma montanum]|uniref:hypothetical protein n=1 Tax=Fibrisoma montanum TaxID=2305895 RepID=UPI0011C21238|nr:hypothetical protein [Fibrisoma montanum]
MQITPNQATQADLSLSERLKKAYERVSPNLRPDAVTAFCDFHRIHPDTFRKKRVGQAVVTEQECEWMEAYRPYKVPA